MSVKKQAAFTLWFFLSLAYAIKGAQAQVPCLKESGACYYQRGMEEYRQGKKSLARMRFSLSCNKGFAKGCNSKGAIYELKGQLDYAAEMYFKSCSLNNTDGCANLEFIKKQRSNGEVSKTAKRLLIKDKKRVRDLFGQSFFLGILILTLIIFYLIYLHRKKSFSKRYPETGEKTLSLRKSLTSLQQLASDKARELTIKNSVELSNSMKGIRKESAAFQVQIEEKAREEKRKLNVEVSELEGKIQKINFKIKKKRIYFDAKIEEEQMQCEGKISELKLKMRQDLQKTISATMFNLAVKETKNLPLSFKDLDLLIGSGKNYPIPPSKEGKEVKPQRDPKQSCGKLLSFRKKSDESFGPFLR